MIRYRLDDLGWFQFESLIQSLLKADLGLTVEAWAGHSDQGCDAYSIGPLTYPSPKKLTNGPFIFQAKFVQEANAAGAKSETALLAAVNSEVKEIEKRIIKGVWTNPSYYTLLSNAPIMASTRKKIRALLGKALPSAKIITLGGRDICNRLDAHPALRRSFPEIMSLRDLDALLQAVVNGVVLERSRAAIAESRDIVPIFVPTGTYAQAWYILQKHNFVVLDGPPEMGKTSIARMIALAQLTHDWQAIECREPGDIFSSYSSDSKQVFIADDAFGRTEYDATLGRLWERDLSKVLNRTDSKHWLIWTSRKHILLRALKEMDLTDKARHFPHPGEVIVTADDLTIEEKSRMLYRHARAANLEEPLRAIIRENAAHIVKDPHFTPERIRRFVKDRLPELAQELQTTFLTPEQIKSEVIEEIRNPTERMQKAFRRLPDIHRWILIALLECGYEGKIESLQFLFNQQMPTTSQSSFTEGLDDLNGTFIKVKVDPKPSAKETVNWIHPSYRDLIIDELARELPLQIKFLEKASLAGIKLALSVAGGGSGVRTFPLMGHKECWHSLQVRSLELAQSWDKIDEILEVLVKASSNKEIKAAHKEYILNILRECCDIAYVHWERDGNDVSPVLLSSYALAARQLDPRPPFPNLLKLWEQASLSMQKILEDETNRLPIDDLRVWSLLTQMIYEFDLKAFEFLDFQKKFQEILQSILDTIETDLSNELEGLTSKEYDAEADLLQEIKEALWDIPLLKDTEIPIEDVLGNLEGQAEIYRRYASEYSDHPDIDFEGRSSIKDFDIVEFFSDL